MDKKPNFLFTLIPNYIKSFGRRAVLPVFEQYATCLSLPFSNTDFIAIVPPHLLVRTFAPSRRAFLEIVPDAAIIMSP